MLASAGCISEQPAGNPQGFKIVVAPLSLAVIGVACYDLAVTTDTDTVWSKGVPAFTTLGHDQTQPPDPSLAVVPANADGDTVCSDQYGNSAGGDITYIGPCDASAGADTDSSSGGVQNIVTLWVDGLYNTTKTTEMGEWQDPCPGGCSLQIDCNENADSLAEFDLTIMRDANQGFFDVAVNFDDIFCSAKFDTCYANATETVADDDNITLLFGADDIRDWTGVFGFTCTAGPDSNTTLAYGAITVACAGGVSFTIDPTVAEGSNHIATSGTHNLQYGVYRGNEQLNCDDLATPEVVESCGKRYWNLALNLADLAPL